MSLMKYLYVAGRMCQYKLNDWSKDLSNTDSELFSTFIKHGIASLSEVQLWFSYIIQ